MADHLKRKSDGTIFTARTIEEDEQVELGGITGVAPAGSQLLTPVAGGPPIIVHPADQVFYDPYDPATAKPPVDFLVLLKMKAGHQPSVYVAHIPLEGDKVGKLGAKAAVEVVVDSLTVRDHREIDAVYVTTAAEMKPVTDW